MELPRLRLLVDGVVMSAIESGESEIPAVSPGRDYIDDIPSEGLHREGLHREGPP